MAITEEVARLILEADTKGFTDAQAKIDATKIALGLLTDGYKAGSIDIDFYLKMGAKLQSDLDDLTAGYKAAGDAAKKYGSNAAAAAALTEAATARATNKMAGLGQAGLQTGRVIQDFAQGGIGGVLNNIEGLSMALGGGPGLAGILTGLGVVFFVLKPVIAEFMKSLTPEPVKEFQGRIETLQARIKELTEKPVKLSIEVKELENAKEQIDAIKKGLAALEAAKTGRTPDEVAAGDKFSKEFAETGAEGKAAIEAVQRQMGEEAAASDPVAQKARKAIADQERSRKAAERAQKEAEQKASDAMAQPGADLDYVTQLAREADSLKKEAERFGDPAAMAKLHDNLRKAVDDAKMRSDKEIGKTFEDVTKGNNPIARGVMADRFRAAGQDKFAGMVDEATPEAVAAQREADAEIERIDFQFEESVKNVKRRWAKIRANEKKRLKEAEEAGRDAEQSPEFKREQAEIDRKWKGVGLVDVDREVVIQRNKKAAADQAKKDAAKDKLEKVPDLEQQQKMRRDRAQEGIARQIYQGSQQVAGVQFTPDQSRAAAKATMEMMASGANRDAAMMAAMGEQLQAMTAMANEMQRNAVELARLRQGFGQVNQFMRQPGGPANLPGGR